MRGVMRPFDYKLIHALEMVINEQSFEKAAEKLNITQSAVSQRIKQLEQRTAKPVIIRTLPYTATPTGEKLLAHFIKIRQLEYDLIRDVLPEDSPKSVPISIAVNADTLASWLIPALTPLLNKHPIELNIQVTNEGNTQTLLKKGEVYAAISSQMTSFSGVKVDYIGSINYILCATPKFKRKYFKGGLTIDNLQNAPCIDYDQRDTMHKDYLLDQFNLTNPDYPCHRIRSSEAVVAMTLAGLAYGLLPTIQAQEHLDSGELIDLAPDKHLRQELYWHSWVLEKGVQQKLSKAILAYGEANFR